MLAAGNGPSAPYIEIDAAHFPHPGHKITLS
jgi:hypothetical protein